MTYLTIFAVVAVAVVLWQGSKWQQRKKIERSLRNSLGAHNQLTLGGRRANAGNNNVSPQVRRKLLRLLGNHQPTVDRLVDQARWKNPGEAEQWYWEKVLYDLERDRWR
jgi:hypothetical protein